MQGLLSLNLRYGKKKIKGIFEVLKLFIILF